ncbi:MAG TPA: hypothetical protein VE153_22180 [Myxococcus sp.]|nr:hypothetical protein [Myxococcus sp.]
MIIRDPVPVFPSLARLGALVALAAVTVWWVRKRRRQGSRLTRRPAPPRAEVLLLPAVAACPAPSGGTGRPPRGGKRRPASASARA